MHVHPAGAAGAGDRAEHLDHVLVAVVAGHHRLEAVHRHHAAGDHGEVGVARRLARRTARGDHLCERVLEVVGRVGAGLDLVEEQLLVELVGRDRGAGDVVTPGAVLAEPLDDLVRARRDLAGGRVEEQQLLLDPEGADGHGCPPARSWRAAWVAVGGPGCSDGRRAGQLSCWGSTPDFASVDPPVPREYRRWSRRRRTRARAGR